ncbi:hypothetical protein OZX74_06950 [Bifidobacterium sp. ESL0798]|uniref:hypothetical protein n=1 Tax=Bifidobacterium sp. ESL0798 TaxID=2983235 RepID=UPI0023F70C11|nr:hypothetical protein [Bifidobacterium sp. ESL0798]WEV73645.1 hypothetical protein OZX74_06950 [Bifidobacterium sp. ESL0798]
MNSQILFMRRWNFLKISDYRKNKISANLGKPTGRGKTAMVKRAKRIGKKEQATSLHHTTCGFRSSSKTEHPSLPAKDKRQGLHRITGFSLHAFTIFCDTLIKFRLEIRKYIKTKYRGRRLGDVIKGRPFDENCGPLPADSSGSGIRRDMEP